MKEVRGRGLMLALELHAEAGGARAMCERLRHEGLLCKETHTNTIRIAPPLVIDADTVDWAIDRFAEVSGGRPEERGPGQGPRRVTQIVDSKVFYLSRLYILFFLHSL